MKIKKLHIEKFRAILRCDIEFKDIMAIVGENNSGKTTILKALNAFFNFEEEEYFFVKNMHQFAVRNNTKIEIVFKDVPYNELYNEYVQNTELVMGMKYEYKNHKRTLYIRHNHNEIPAKKEVLDNIKQNICYLYIPATRGDRELMWGENSLFSKLIIEFSKRYTSSRDTVSKYVQNAASKLHSSILEKIERQLENLFPINENYKFDIQYRDRIDFNLLLDNLVLSTCERGTSYPIQQYGSGIKSLTIIAIFRTLAAMNNINIILGIEEPETNLHPQMQKQFIAALKDGKMENEVQLVMATHSTVIVDELSHEDIVLVRREYNNSRNRYTSVVTQIRQGFFQNAGLLEFNYQQFFGYRNSDFFFSKYVIVTESKTDSQVIRHLISKELGWRMSYISMIDLNGVTGLQYPYFLLKELKIPFSVVVDRDFFTPYLHDELERSRNAQTGFPEYKRELNESNIINDLLTTQAKKDLVLNALNGTVYNTIYNVLKPYKFYCMQYCLEMDLVCSEKICQEYYTYFNMMPNEQTSKELLIRKKKVIKKIENILKAMNAVQYRSYPISLRKIKSGLLEDINQYL